MQYSFPTKGAKAKLFGLVGASLSAAMLSATPAAAQKCEYKFNGTVQVKHNGIVRPMPNLRLRVRREKGTGAGRWERITDANGRYSFRANFDRDGNGRLPGKPDINFIVEGQFIRHGANTQNGQRAGRWSEFRVRQGGVAEDRWFPIRRHKGKDCRSFNSQPFIFDTDDTSSVNRDINRRAYIFHVADKLAKELDSRGLGFKSRLTFIYPNRAKVGPDDSWYLLKAHIDQDHWDNVTTVIHEAMHQWDVNWMRGEKSLSCLVDAHHKPVSNWRSSRCSGFMEGFAAATSRALYNDIFSSSPFYWKRKDKKDYFNDPMSHAALQSRTGSSLGVTNQREAERHDAGWRNYLMFHMWPNVWSAFNTRAGSGLYDLTNCKPRRVPIYQMLTALKKAAPDHAGSNASFNWFGRIMQNNVQGYTSRDNRFYILLGDPSKDPVSIQQQFCAAQRNAQGKGAS